MQNLHQQFRLGTFYENQLVDVGVAGLRDELRTSLDLPSKRPNISFPISLTTVLNALAADTYCSEPVSHIAVNFWRRHSEPLGIQIEILKLQHLRRVSRHKEG